MAEVCSVNIVGYINANISKGFSLIANQLNASPDNKLSTLFTSLPDGSQFYKWNGSSYVFIEYVDGSWGGDNPDEVLNPGQAAWINAPSAFTQTYVGEVQLTSTVVVAPGFGLVSSVLPQSLPLTGDPPGGLGFPIGNEDEIYQWGGTGWVFNKYVDGAWEGDGGGNPPTVAIAESFWVKNASASKNWNRTFTVCP
jgi:hypothetical protein